MSLAFSTSPPAVVHHRTNGEDWIEGATLHLAASGVYRIEYYAGRLPPEPESVTVQVDAGPPTIGGWRVAPDAATFEVEVAHALPIGVTLDVATGGTTVAKSLLMEHAGESVYRATLALPPTDVETRYEATIRATSPAGNQAEAKVSFRIWPPDAPPPVLQSEPFPEAPSAQPAAARRNADAAPPALGVGCALGLALLLRRSRG